MELICPALPDPCLLPESLSTARKAAWLSCQHWLCESIALCWACHYPTDEALALAFLSFLLLIARCLQPVLTRSSEQRLGAH